MNPIPQTCLYDGNFYSVFIDTNQNISQRLKLFSQNLTEELKRLMDFFGITKLSKKIIIKIHSDIEEWKRFRQADSFYADYVVGMARNCTINVHICHQNLQPDFNKVTWFMGEGLATYLANQRYNQDEKIDFPKEVYFSGDETYSLWHNCTNIPDGVVAAGVPCKVIRKITEKYKKYWTEMYQDYVNYADFK